ncbi:MASE4 domain-containing protein [Pararoseomonas indoligenes]|uniref:histidine kinase n=1 Tax=Roseomonas indoligenes TaxID=2820811 RepID=A0A940N392_9PROT|nr:MASE4 domain-containing protein [Pararoseomonas indoligenes]MBP0495960.1 MASE4 domain-containing protein [Pararoseomonas indoligenes]
MQKVYDFSAAPAGTPAMRGQRLAAGCLCLLAVVATVFLLPFADVAGPAIPGFMLVHQTSLVIAYGLSAWVLFAQFRRAPAMPLLLIAAGTLYTAAIVLLQLLSVPNLVAGGRVLGAGPETTTWLWTFWHLGPPACTIAYALTLRRAQDRPMPRKAGALAALAALSAAGLSAVISTLGLPWLPHQVTGDDYTALTTSGVGPAVQLLTIAALVLVWRAARGRRTVLDLWVAASMLLLVLDNFLTMAGASRGSVGWYVGRIEALVSAFVILWAYLHEVDALRARAEAAAAEAALAGAALRQAQKMEAVGRLTGGIAHDFNNLLMVVTSGFDMIRRRPEDHARVLKLADAGLEAAQRGARLTRQLLTFARRQKLRPETMNLNATLLEFEPLVRRALGEAAELRLELDPALHPARVDPGEFEAAVLNLVVNARDALPPGGGRVTITTGTRSRVARPAAAELLPEPLPAGDYVVLSVADNGRGMDEATRLQAFEPFFTTKEFGKGSGLGLSQVYGFARAAGGAVEITSSPGRGALVEIWLPRAQHVAQEAPVAGTATGASSLRRAEEGEVVLAVEDEPAVLAAVVENLQDLGYRVIPARDAAEALEHLRGSGRVDILFSDVVMPGGMNGVQLAVEAGRLRAGLRVLLTSGYTDEALSGQHGVPSDVPILTKPYRREELADRLRVARQASRHAGD